MFVSNPTLLLAKLLPAKLKPIPGAEAVEKLWLSVYKKFSYFVNSSLILFIDLNKSFLLSIVFAVDSILKESESSLYNPSNLIALSLKFCNFNFAEPKKVWFSNLE